MYSEYHQQQPVSPPRPRHAHDQPYSDEEEEQYPSTTGTPPPPPAAPSASPASARKQQQQQSTSKKQIAFGSSIPRDLTTPPNKRSGGGGNSDTGGNASTTTVASSSRRTGGQAAVSANRRRTAASPPATPTSVRGNQSSPSRYESPVRASPYLDRQDPTLLMEEALAARRRAEEAEHSLANERFLVETLRREKMDHAEAMGKKDAKIEELSRLVQVSTNLAEQVETERTVLNNENEKLKEEVSRCRTKLFNLEEDNSKLESELTVMKCDLSNLKSDAARDKEDYTRQIQKLRSERDNALFTCDELRGDISSKEKKHEATVELLHARHTSIKNSLDDQVDQLKVANEDLTQSLEEAVSSSEKFQSQVDDLNRQLKETGEKFTRRLEEMESIHRLRVDELDQKIRHLRNNEGTLEHHIDVLLSRATALQATIEGQESALAKQRAEIETQKELNHVLAIKLKAALADKEASAMEAETRRILTQQNEEMERQMGELRRTIADLMARR